MSFVHVYRWIENGMRAPTQRLTIIILHGSVILYANHMCIALDAVQNAYLSCLTNVLCVCFCAVCWSITYELKTARCAPTRYYKQNFARTQLIYIYRACASRWTQFKMLIFHVLTDVSCVSLRCVLPNCRWIENGMPCAYTRYYNQNFARPKLIYK